MIPFTITDNETKTIQSYELPTCWEDVTWEQYQNYTSVMRQEFHSVQDKITAQLAVLCQMDIESAQQLGWQFATRSMEHLGFVNTTPTGSELAHVSIDGETYYRQPLETWGEFMAYDKIWSNPNLSIEDKIPYILALGMRKANSTPVYQPVKSWWDRVILRKPKELVEKVTYEAAELEPEWMEARSKLFSYSLNVTQVMSLSAFFLSNAQHMQEVTQTFSSLQSLILPKAESLEAVSVAIMDGKWQHGIFAPILLKGINFYFYLLSLYFNNSNTNALSLMNKPDRKENEKNN